MDYASLLNGFLLGCVGQLIRFGLGLYKWTSDPNRTDAFDWRIAASSLVMGGAGGIIGSFLPSSTPLMVVVCGYGGADAIEGLVAKFMPWAPAVVFALLSLSLLAAPSPASAKNPTGYWNDSPFAQWFDAQRDRKGGSCCGNGDASPFDAAYRLLPDGTADLTVNGSTYNIPHFEVLDPTQPAALAALGHAWIWTNGSWPGPAGTLYCFEPGPAEG